MFSRSQRSSPASSSDHFAIHARFLPNRRQPMDSERIVDTVSMFGNDRHGDQLMTRDVCTRWYKAPEMLFGSVTYSLGASLPAASPFLI